MNQKFSNRKKIALIANNWDAIEIVERFLNNAA